MNEQQKLFEMTTTRRMLVEDEIFCADCREVAVKMEDWPECPSLWWAGGDSGLHRRKSPRRSVRAPPALGPGRLVRMTARARTCVFLPVLLVLLVLASPAGGRRTVNPATLRLLGNRRSLRLKVTWPGNRKSSRTLATSWRKPKRTGTGAMRNRAANGVEYYESRVAAAEAQITAAQAGLAKQTELDEAGEPQDRLREVKESIEYYETLRDESQKAGATGTVELAVDELEGGTFGGGLYELQEKAEAERAAKEAVAPEETDEETNEVEETNETTEAAAPPPGDGDGGGEARDEAAPGEPDPTPDEAPEPENSGPGIGGGLPDINPVPILAFIGLVAVAIFALAKAGGTSVREYFSPKQLIGPVMGQSKKTKPKKPKPEKTKRTPVATKPQEPALGSPEIEASEEPEDKKPRPEPGENDGDEKPGFTAEELDELFGGGADDEEEEEGDDENPPD